jgi:hypothetical protein
LGSKAPAPTARNSPASCGLPASPWWRSTRPDRKTRRRKGKSDPIDAYAAADAVLSGRATGTPKTRDGIVEAIRALRLPKRSALKARTQAINPVHRSPGPRLRPPDLQAAGCSTEEDPPHSAPQFKGVISTSVTEGYLARELVLGWIRNQRGRPSRSMANLAQRLHVV